jgi:hypothetical protein
MRAVIVLNDYDQAIILSLLDKLDMQEVPVSYPEHQWIEKFKIYFSKSEVRSIEPDLDE